MTAMSDDGLDLELVAFLREQADDLFGAPDAATMAWRLSSKERSMRWRLDGLVARPMVRLAVVAMLLAAFVGTTLIVGAVRRSAMINGQVVLTSGLVLDVATGQMFRSPLCGGRCVDAMDVAYTRDGRTLAIVDQDGLVGDLQTGAAGMSIWRYDGGSEAPRLLADCPPAGGCFRPSFSVDDERLAYVEADRDPTSRKDFDAARVVVVDLATGDRRIMPTLEGFPLWLSWTSEGRIVAAIQADDRDRRTFVIDPTTGTAVEPFDHWPFATATASPDGTRVALLVNDTGSRSDGIMHPEDHVFDIWLADVRGTDLRHLYRGDPAIFDSRSHLLWSPDGRRLALGFVPIGADPRVLIIDAGNGAVIQSVGGPAVTAWPPGR
jgi:hypothetical protein